MGILEWIGLGKSPEDKREALKSEIAALGDEQERLKKELAAGKGLSSERLKKKVDEADLSGKVKKKVEEITVEIQGIKGKIAEKEEELKALESQDSE